MYHRIAELDCDPWGLAVSPSHFSEHLEILRRHSTISMPDLIQALASGVIPHRPVVITFDDGYADNVETAQPLLEQYAVPATVYLTTGAIGSEREFWWDELQRVLLERHDLPVELDLRGYRRELASDATYRDSAHARHRSWRAWDEPPTARHTMYAELWQRLYRLPNAEKRAFLDELLAWAELEPCVRSTHRLISVDEAMQLGRSALIEVGAHTVTHPALPMLPMASQAEEIQQSRRLLEDLLHRDINCFAYPHGDHQPDTVAAVRASGFTSACTTAAGVVSAQSDWLTLPRVQVLDWTGEEFRARLETLLDLGTQA
jgi:peptidoglycan/xylan/chitin deacetylase (PgdA/CDA1 family)